MNYALFQAGLEASRPIHDAPENFQMHYFTVAIHRSTCFWSHVKRARELAKCTESLLSVMYLRIE